MVTVVVIEDEVEVVFGSDGIVKEVLVGQGDSGCDFEGERIEREVDSMIVIAESVSEAEAAEADEADRNSETGGIMVMGGSRPVLVRSAVAAAAERLMRRKKGGNAFGSGGSILTFL
jgi:hypothetical protein